ncbi:MAG: M23 family metallopeptidase [Balneola sp.]|nr:MAG: M23 family metallopeptidase [Balneola sp.]
MKFTLLFLFIPSLILAQESKSVELYNVEKEDKIEVFVKNDNIFPITLQVEMDFSNLRPSQGLPLTEVIDAKADIKILELFPIKQHGGWELETSYRFFMGSIFADHTDDFVYRLPYRLGTQRRVSQGYNGQFSHTGSLRYSVDFQMPEGTQIYAARSGIVVETEESYREGGDDKYYIDKANYITVLHDDGTFSEYSHLRPNGVVVSVGQRIRTGQLIGYSGTTGYTTGPHLHFNVKRVVQDGRYITIPVKFATREGNIQLIEGENYRAL